MKRQTLWLAPLTLLATAAPFTTALADTAQSISQPATLSAPHLRVLPLQGGRNFRDLGGYRTADGRHVKWGLLFRSGAMHGLTSADYAYLQRRNIKVVCDFRSTGERAAEPSNWPAGTAPTILADDYQLLQSGAMPKGDMRSWTPKQARAAMAATYPAMLTSFAGQYRRMFAELLAGHAPLAFHCTLDTSQILGTGALSKLPAPARAALLTADQSYIEAALHALDQHPGGVMGYLHDEMGLSPEDIARLRSLYLE